MNPITLTRLKLDLTQEQFAALLGVKRNAVSNWERGIKTPSKRNQYKIDQLGKEQNQ
jgi:DNA-binding transcriptional regulator YiaG